jgi:primary-amine oxidase
MRTSFALLLGLFAALAVVAAPSTQEGDPIPKPKPKEGDQQPMDRSYNEIIQTFPSNDVMRTAWKVRWATKIGNGLYIQGAWYKKSPKDAWFQVLGDARVAEIFVPYQVGDPRFWDVSYNFPLCPVDKNYAGPNGVLLTDLTRKPNEGKRPIDVKAPTVVKEIRDRGPAWQDLKTLRRGQEMVLWASLNAANYRYLMEYGFHDDGTVTFRLGSTGIHYTGREKTTHMHNCMWRVDVNVGGPDNNSVYVMEHEEPANGSNLKGKTNHSDFNGGKEGFLDWDPNKFTMVRFKNTQLTNARGENICYDLMSMRSGNSRHFGGANEECTQHDVWITKKRDGEMSYTRLPQYVKKGDSVMDTDVVLWHSTPAYHTPRSEDGQRMGQTMQGAIPVMWSGFCLRPHHLHDSTPLYP